MTNKNVDIMEMEVEKEIEIENINIKSSTIMTNSVTEKFNTLR